MKFSLDGTGGAGVRLPVAVALLVAAGGTASAQGLKTLPYLGDLLSDLQTQINSKAAADQALAGDLGGTLAAPKVTAVQNRAISPAAPSDGQALVWNASAGEWQPQNVSGGTSQGSGVADPGANGLVVRTSQSAAAARTLTAGSARLTVTNGNGVGGNPTVDLGVLTNADVSGLSVGGDLSGTIGAATVRHAIHIPLAGKPIGTGTGSVALPVSVDYSCTIYKAMVIANAPGSLTVDIWKAAGTVPGSGNKISASAPVTLSSAQINQNSPLTGWSTAVSSGDVFWASVASADGVLAGATVQIWCH